MRTVSPTPYLWLRFNATSLPMSANYECRCPPLSSSEVFEAQLRGGMREAAEKRVVVEDIDKLVFHALLKFCYTDDLALVEEWTKSAISESDGGNMPEAGKRISVLQRILAAGHKYQLARLRLWSEQQLCALIDVSSCCNVLCQARTTNTPPGFAADISQRPRLNGPPWYSTILAPPA